MQLPSASTSSNGDRIAQAMKVKNHISPSQQSEKWTVSVDLQLGTPDNVAELKHRKTGQEPIGRHTCFMQ